MKNFLSDPFKKTARKNFDFLIKDFNAVFTEEADLNDCSPSLFSSVRYDLPSVYIRIYREKGVVGLMLAVKGDTRIIRPYISHQFELVEIMTYLNPKGCFKQSPPSSGDEKAELMFLRDNLLEYCAPILRGDIEILEELALHRGRN